MDYLSLCVYEKITIGLMVGEFYDNIVNINATIARQLNIIHIQILNINILLTIVIQWKNIIGENDEKTKEKQDTKAIERDDTVDEIKVNAKHIMNTIKYSIIMDL